VAFVITVPGADDVMLGYQSLAFHDVLTTRRTLGLRPAAEFEAWLRKVGMVDEAGTLTPFDLTRSPLRSLTSTDQ
jgi:ethanolamine ammonia-lyase large subunit